MCVCRCGRGAYHLQEIGLSCNDPSKITQTGYRGYQGNIKIHNNRTIHINITVTLLYIYRSFPRQKHDLRHLKVSGSIYKVSGNAYKCLETHIKCLETHINRYKSIELYP